MTERCFVYHIFNGPKMSLDIFDYLTNCILIEVDDSVEIQFGTQNIKKHILTMTFVEFSDSIGKFIKHWKTLARITCTWNH